MINDGEIKEKVRGTVRDGILTSCKLIRSATVQVVEQSGVRVRERFSGLTMARWLELHPDVPDPKGAGYQMKRLKVQGEVQLCVLIRKQPVGEFDVEIESTLHAVQKEEHENSDQQAPMFENNVSI